MSHDPLLIFSLRLKTLLLLVVFLAYLPAFSFTLYRYLERRNTVVFETQSVVEQTLEFTNIEIEKAFGNIEKILVLLANDPVIENGSPEECNDFVKNILRNHPQYMNFGVADKNGNVFCSALELDRQLNLSDRTYFLDAKEFQSFATGKYRINAITQEPSVSFGYPVLEKDKTIGRVVFASINIGWFGDLTKDNLTQDEMVITLIDRDGTVLARQPEFETWVGKSVSDEPFVNIITTRQDRGATETEGLDRVKRYYGFSPLFINGVHSNNYLAVGSSLGKQLFQVDKIFLPILLLLGSGSLILALALILDKSSLST